MNLKNTKPLKQVLIALAILLCSFQHAFAQDNSTISLLRPKQSMMSGGAGFTIQVYLNDVRIDDLANGMAINYSMFSDGNIKLKFQKEGMGSIMGAPKILELGVNKGNTYYYFIEAGMNDLTVKVIDKKAAEKLTGKSKNFDATIELNESSDNPIIK